MPHGAIRLQGVPGQAQHEMDGVLRDGVGIHVGRIHNRDTPQGCGFEINRIDAKLSNPDFIARAPEEVVEADREKREEAVARRAKIVEALERLKQVE